METLAYVLTRPVGMGHVAARALLVLVVLGCSGPAVGDPVTWLPRQLGSASLDYATHDASTWETRPVCACDVVIEQAGGDLEAATVTQGALTRGGLPGGSLLVTVLRARGTDPARMLEAMVTHGQLEQLSRSDIALDGRSVTVLNLPAWTTGRAYLTIARDTLVLVQDASEETALEFIRALP